MTPHSWIANPGLAAICTCATHWTELFSDQLSNFIVLGTSLTQTVSLVGRPKHVKFSLLLQAVSTRACYLFSRLVRVLRQNMRAFVREVLHSIQGHLVHIATHPPTEGAQGTNKAGGPGGAKITTMGAFLPATDDRCGVQLPAVHAVGWFL